MCRCVWTLFFLSLVGLGSSAPGFRKGMSEEAETSLNKFLKVYLDEVENDGVSDDDLYGKMLGDQPQDENTIHHTGSSTTGESRNITSVEYSRAMRNRNRPNDPDERSRENRIQELKDTILKYIGRKPEDELPNVSVNVTKDLPKFWNLPNISSNDQVTEKIRSFYPSCEIPANTDQDLWKDDDMMNLFFNFDIFSETKNSNIATATLRLYRLPENNTKTNNKPDCESFNSAEEEKLLRVSIYWYTKSLKKRRVKKRLSDSKVISETAQWIDLSVKPATKAWSRGRNLGLGVLVEDQEGNNLRANRIFKGTSCTPRQNPYLPSSLTQPDKQTNWTEFIAYLDAIQHQPYIVTYICSQH